MTEKYTPVKHYPQDERITVIKRGKNGLKLCSKGTLFVIDEPNGSICQKIKRQMFYKFGDAKSAFLKAKGGAA